MIRQVKGGGTNEHQCPGSTLIQKLISIRPTADDDYAVLDYSISAEREAFSLFAAGTRSLVVVTEHRTHHPHELEGAGIADAVIDTVGILARDKDAFVAQNGEVL